MDALSEVLRLVRLTGSVFLNAELSAPWAIESPPSKVLAEALIPDAEHVIEYHLIVEVDASSRWPTSHRSNSRRVIW